MKPSQLATYLDSVFKHKVKHTTFIWGDHGIAKSSIVRSVTEANGYRLIDFRTAQVESIDVAGMYYPVENNGSTSITNLSPTYYADMLAEASANNGNSKICLFFDELNMSRRETMNATFEVILDRRVKGKKIPDDVIIICAGNPESDKYDTTTMSESLKDRFVHVYLSPDQQDWTSWARSNKIHEDVIHFGSSGLFDFTDSGFRVNLSPSPRSLHRLSDFLKLSLPSEIEEEVVLGILGKEKGLAFIKNRVSQEKALTAQELISIKGNEVNFNKFKKFCDPKNTRLDILSTCYDNFNVDFTKDNNPYTDSEVDSIVAFMEVSPVELLVKFWSGVDTNFEQTYANKDRVESLTVPLLAGRHSEFGKKLLEIAETVNSTENDKKAE